MLSLQRNCYVALFGPVNLWRSLVHSDVVKASDPNQPGLHHSGFFIA